ncbi:MAG: DUF4399 domain-containing protein [Gemmatimonadota bacterium]|uniref:DUF4399 domain-containing protein n=1 Tax=Candidatus Palauibacter scopulicola TaxID=3056741 RepID=UPI0023965DBA|nr:DUF4399 domain-containing protein [Candidatus Palauibacter scopulicola]MDE2661398.1 DUF4399 domain-containing protein [Candidatus Palauibacter scopulicola]
MRFPRPRWIPVAFVAPLSLAIACGGGEPAEDAEMAAEPAEEMPAEPAVTVRITQPEEGATVGPDVLVVMETDGIEIVSITPPVVGTGHHHLYVDVDLTPLSELIPQNDPQIIHMGDGSTEYMLEGLAPGEHRLIAVVANPAHIPLDPPVVDTLHFTVANEE